MNNLLILFTDGSVNPQSKIGYGACLAVTDINLSIDSMKDQVYIKRFEDTSSTKLELQTLLWALGDIQTTGRKVMVYTDSQNILGLPTRRERLEKNDYHSKKHKRLKHFELYQAFYSVIDQLDCELVKVRGHQAANQKDDMDRLFTLVDRASRKALRAEGEQSGY